MCMHMPQYMYVCIYIRSLYLEDLLCHTYIHAHIHTNFKIMFMKGICLYVYMYVSICLYVYMYVTISLRLPNRDCVTVTV